MKNNKLFIGIIVVLIALLAFVFLRHPSRSVGASVYGGSTTIDSSLIVSDNLTVAGATTTSATSGTVSYSVSAGVDEAYIEQSFTATSSIPCIIPNPFGAATTTITAFTAVITSGTANLTGLFDLATSSATALGGYGSSTPTLIQAHSVSGGAQDYMAWLPNAASTTNSKILSPVSVDGASNLILGPSQNLVYRNATGTPGTFATYWTGTCSAIIIKN